MPSFQKSSLNIFSCSVEDVFRFKFILLILLAWPADSVRGQITTDSLWSYQSIFKDMDGNHALDHEGEEVIVTGVANVASGLLHETYLQIFIQNDSLGLPLFSMRIDQPVTSGDSIIAKGKVERYFGMAEVHVESYRVIENVGTPTALPLETIIADKEKYVGMLAEGEGTIIEKGHEDNGTYVIISQENNRESLQVYVSNFHTLHSDFKLDVLSVGDRISVTGILSEFSPDFPSDRMFKFHLRTPEDLQHLSFPKYYFRMMLLGTSILGVLILGWAITLRKKVDSKTREIQLSLKQKELLLKEIHHRVKNSLSIVSGLIEIQRTTTDNSEAIHVLQDSQTRIQSIALIHDKLYKTESLSDIEMDYYIEDLVRSIHGTFTERKEAVALHFDLANVTLETDRAVHCGLLINELVVNAFKYAFSPNNKGNLYISLKRYKNNLVLTVSDDGPGLKAKFNSGQQESLGSMLIHSFASHLHADMEITERAGGGTSFKFQFPYSKGFVRRDKSAYTEQN